MDFVTIYEPNGNIQLKDWQQFIASTLYDEQIDVCIADLHLSKCKAKLYDLLTSNELKLWCETYPKEICAFSNSTIIFICSVASLTWFLKQTKTGKYTRLHKLVEIEQKPPKTTTKEQYNVTCAEFINDTYDEIVDFDDLAYFKYYEGSKKEISEYMQVYYETSQIHTRFANKCKFAINCTEDDLMYRSSWKTIEQLEKEGVISLK